MLELEPGVVSTAWGSSYATPLVSGAAALLISTDTNTSDCDSEAVKRALLDGARVFDTYSYSAYVKDGKSLKVARALPLLHCD